MSMAHQPEPLVKLLQINSEPTTRSNQLQTITYNYNITELWVSSNYKKTTKKQLQTKVQKKDKEC